MIISRLRFFLLLIALLFINSTLAVSQEKLTHIGLFEDENTFFTQHSKAMFFQDEVIIVDQNESILHRFSDSGELIQLASRQGRGPGEVGHPTSVSQAGTKHRLLILDSSNQFIHEFSTSDFEHLHSHSIDFSISFLSRIAVTDNSLVLTGSKEGSDNLIHVYDLENYEYLHSFGDFIDWDATGIDTINPMIRTQLYTGSVLEYGEHLIAGITAPYIIRKYGPDQEILWEVEDDVFQSPWEEHIKVTPERYEVGMYPRIWDMKPLDATSFLVQYVIMEGDRDDWEYWIDIRSVRDGDLKQRFMLSEQMLIQDVAIRENGEINLLFRKAEDFSFASYRLNR
jgi:hypothetical protein